MQVKCRCCGKMIDREIAYKVITNKQNTYYCTEKEYLNKIQQSQYHTDMINKIFVIFNCMITNTILFKEISELEMIYSSKVILNYLSANEDYLKKLLSNKSFSSQYAKIRYFTTILKNNLADYKDNTVEMDNNIENKISEIEIVNMKYKQKKKRRSIAEIEEEI